MYVYVHVYVFVGVCMYVYIHTQTDRNTHAYSGLVAVGLSLSEHFEALRHLLHASILCIDSTTPNRIVRVGCYIERVRKIKNDPESVPRRLQRETSIGF